jgi:hypothetical protein
MGQWWKYALRLIAIVAASAPGIMNVFGCFESFVDPVIAYFAAGVGLCADVYLLASHSAIHDAKRKKRELAHKVGVAIWLACALWTGLSSASWLQHKLEAAQAPVEQQRQTQKKTEGERQADLASERATVTKQEDATLAAKSKEAFERASKLAAETLRIKALEAQNTFPAKTENAPIKSPFSGYEKLVTFLLLAFSQGCWFMARYEEPEAEAETGTARKPEISDGNDAPVPPRKRRKQAGNGARKSAGTEPGNANVIKFRKPPTKEEILAFVDRNLADGNDKWEGAKERFGYTPRHLRNFLNEKSGSQAAA